MLADQFFLVLETIRSHASDGSVKVVSITPHILTKLPPAQNSRGGTPGLG